MSTALKNTALVILSLFVGALLLEVGLRFIITLPSPAPTKLRLMVADARGFWVFDPEITFTQDNRTDFHGKSVSIGKNGMRQVPCRKTPANVESDRVFIIGDSQTFGYGLSDEESWPNRLQCRLNTMKPHTAVHNLGVPGINTDQYLVRFSQIWPHLRRGDLIVVTLTWNDLVTDLGSFDPAKFKITNCPTTGQQPITIDFPLCLVHPKKYLNPVVTWRLKLYRSTGLYVPSFGSPKEFAYTILYTSALAFVAVPKIKALWYTVRSQSALLDKLPENTFRNSLRVVARLRDIATEKGAQTQVVLLPNRVFTDDYYYRAYSQGGRVFTERDFPRQATAAACQNYKLDCFSLFGALQTSDRDRFTFAYDGHLNPAGAEAVANALAEKLARRLEAPAKIAR